MQQTTGVSSNLGSFAGDSTSPSAVSWPAILAGAAAAAALSLILLALGAGFGLLSASPFSSSSSSTEWTTAALIWLIVNEIVASGAGGYLAGRLRTKWSGVHTHEVYFRDTAHGFLAWATAVIITGAFLGTAATSLVGGSISQASSDDAADNYYVDTLFRAPAGGTLNGPGLLADQAARGEAATILAHALSPSESASIDQTYLTQLVSSRTGMSAEEASKRVSDVIDRARRTSETVHKSTARFLLWSFLALLIGAFSASFAATIGGRQRDHMSAL